LGRHDSWLALRDEGAWIIIVVEENVRGNPMRRFRSVVIAALLAAAPLSAKAALLDFSFVFTNLAFGEFGTVSGIVRGLADNGTSAATSLEILSNSDSFGLGEYIGSPRENTWTVSGGQITAYGFLAFGSLNSPPDVTCCSLSLDSTVSNGTALAPDPTSFGSRAGQADIVFTPVSVPVPETPKWAMLVLGFAGLAAAGRLSRRFNITRASQAAR
jgi:hypothetical protein